MPYSRQARIKKMTESKVFTTPTDGFAQSHRVIKVSDLEFKTNQSNLEHTIEDLHDILEADYKVARKRFVDVICMQASDHFLVTGPKTPIKLFSPGFVGNLTDAELERIAGEEPVQKRKREDLKHEVEVLEKGRRILN